MTNRPRQLFLFLYDVNFFHVKNLQQPRFEIESLENVHYNIVVFNGTEGQKRLKTHQSKQ